MPVAIYGQISGRERNAAEELRRRLIPALRPQDRITIIVGAKSYEQPTEDIDILLLGQMAPGFKAPPEAVPAQASTSNVYLQDFVLMIEVKDHDGSGVKFEGNQVFVRYPTGWNHASQKLETQKYSLKNFVESNIGLHRSPWINTALWLRNVQRDEVPRAAAPILTSEVSAVDVFRLVIGQSLARTTPGPGGGFTVSSSTPQAVQGIVKFFTKVRLAGTLDRRKLEAICKKIMDDQQYHQLIGQQALIFRGRGGAGKTVRLLSIANQLREEQGARVLLLTYNLALVADIRRLLTFLGNSSEVSSGSIVVRGRDSYLDGLLTVCGYPSPDRNEPFENLGARKSALADLLKEMTTEQIQRNEDAIKNPEYFGWDYVLVDEGQDWPEVDRDILLKVFGVGRLIIADGIDQFAERVPRRCDWTSAKPHQIVTLKKSLRLKSNLCRFAESFASEFGIPWDMQADDKLPGGGIHIIVGKYTRQMHADIMAHHQQGKNLPIDALFCVTGAADAVHKDFSRKLQDFGYEVWDGTTRDGRQDFARSTDQHRVVKYESCRGLEGWTVVCLDMASFFSRKLREGRSLPITDLLMDQEELALSHAARWCLIPFTRAIDTLVLQMDAGSDLWKRLAPIARQHSDIVKITE